MLVACVPTALRRYHGSKRKALSNQWRTLLDKSSRRLGRLGELSASELFWYVFRSVMVPTPSHSRTHSRVESMGSYDSHSSGGSSSSSGGGGGSAYSKFTSPLNKIQNSSLVVTVTRVGRSYWCQTFLAVLKSAVPYLVFLALYGANDWLHVLPRYSDLSCITLHNISRLEYSVLHFSPHKIISAHHTLFLDFLAAVPYLLHYTLPVVYPLYLLMKGNTDDIQRFFWLLGWIMWVQYVIWYVFPTAPPWFYDNQQYYAAHHMNAPPLRAQHKEGCAFRRLDDVTGLHFFFKMFGGNPVPFGAFPSGHVAWPTTIFVIRPPGGRTFALYVLWVAWATLYSCHHYLTDALGAILLVVAVKKVLYLIRDKKMTSLGTERERLLLPGDRDGGSRYQFIISWPCSRKTYTSDSLV